MNTIKAFGKFLDQPVLVNKFSRAVTPAVALGAGAIVLHDTHSAPKEYRKNELIQQGFTAAGAVSSAVAAPFIISKLFRTPSKIANLKQIKQNNSKLVDEFVANNEVTQKTDKILNKVRNNILSVKEIKELSKNMESEEGQKLISGLIPEPENITSKEIFSEIGRLSVFGLIPVVGGIAGGIVGDKLTDENYKEKIPNKVKEGAYQYLANIFLCNIGAGAALGILEKMNIHSKAARAAGMVSGIILTGVIGGSAIANYIGKHFIDKCFKCKDDEPTRKPEALDICLHSDDIATVAVMSGLKWIEPVLPALYSISGYRAGIGYRGGESKKDHNKKQVMA